MTANRISVRSPRVAFVIKPLDPEHYRQQTRRSTLLVAGSFVLLTLVCSTLAVQLFGQPGGDNFRLNLAGVIVALALTIALVRGVFWSQPWMAAAVYGWQLKRNLMRVTNVMHQVTAGVKVEDPLSMKILRFYHLGVSQMHQLDGNSGEHVQMLAEINQHQEKMQALNISLEQTTFDPEWIKQLERRA
ncbi:DUF3087 domain-containing protein [Pseudomonas sp. RL_15y_Pfl2_60]|uniref:DUF3087 domain-containing protein n=1 Tax=Pseudomonas sp. RL_15y_Pfl2_60 TaxID=3088709 RepID=UPI0030D6E8E2